MKYLFFLLLSISIYAQNIVSGTVVSENNFVLQNVMIVNIKTGNKVFSDNEGRFNIVAKKNDELRFIKGNFERGSKIVQNNDFITPLSIQLVRIPIEIEEVKIVNRPSGDLGKDSKNYNTSEKVVALNKDIRQYLKTPLAESPSKNNIPSSFAPKDPYAGQLNLLSVGIGGSSIGVIGLVVKELFEKRKLKPNFLEIQNFHKKVKDTFYGSYYIKRGLNESDFDRYIIYLDDKYKFSENHFSNFDSAQIEKMLKKSLKEFIN